MENEKIETFDYNGYRVNIFAEDPDKEDTGFFFTITEYDENNIPTNFPIYDSSKVYICENQDQAEEDAKDWIDEFEDLDFNNADFDLI